MIAQFFLDPKLDGEAVRIPSGLALDLKALHGLVPREDILDGTRHDVVYTRHPIGRWRAFVENIALPTFAIGHTFLENSVLLPVVEDFLGDLWQIQSFVFGKFHDGQSVATRPDFYVPRYGCQLKAAKLRNFTENLWRKTDKKKLLPEGKSYSNR